MQYKGVVIELNNDSGVRDYVGIRKGLSGRSLGELEAHDIRYYLGSRTTDHGSQSFKGNVSEAGTLLFYNNAYDVEACEKGIANSGKIRTKEN